MLFEIRGYEVGYDRMTLGYELVTEYGEFGYEVAHDQKGGWS